MNIRIIASLWCLALGTTACTAVNNYKSAHTLGQGATEVLVAPQAHTAGPQDGLKVPFPELAISVRHGIRERIDLAGTFTALPLGERLSAYGVEGAVKVHLYRSPGRRLDIAAGGGLGYRTVESSGAIFEAVNAAVPVTFGINLGDDELAISPTLYWQRWYSMGASPVDIPAAGVSIGYRWQMTEHYALLPEVGWARSPTDIQGDRESALLHAGIAIIRGPSRTR